MADACNQTEFCYNLTVSNNFTIEFLNYERRKNFIPAISLVCLTIVVGAIGNAIVIYVYRRYFPKTPANIFIWALACIDLMTCVLGLPYEVLDQLFPYIYGQQLFIPCRVCRFFLNVGTMLSMLILGFVSYERYRKICKPLQHFPGSTARRLLYGGALFSSVRAAAGVYLDEVVQKPTRIEGIYGYDCSRKLVTLVAIVFQGITSVAFFGCILANCIFYTAIVITLRKRPSWSQRKPTLSNMSIRRRTAKFLRSESMANLFSRTKSAYNGNSETSERQSTGTGNVYTIPSSSSEENGTVSKSKTKSIASGLAAFANVKINSGSGRTGGGALKTKRLTWMLMTVNVGFLICFLPYFTADAITMTSDASVRRLFDNTLDTMLALGDRAYTANSFINPLIYSCFNPKFRARVLGIFRSK